MFCFTSVNKCFFFFFIFAYLIYTLFFVAIMGSAFITIFWLRDCQLFLYIYIVLLNISQIAYGFTMQHFLVYMNDVWQRFIFECCSPIAAPHIEGASTYSENVSESCCYIFQNWTTLGTWPVILAPGFPKML